MHMDAQRKDVSEADERPAQQEGEEGRSPSCIKAHGRSAEKCQRS